MTEILNGGDPELAETETHLENEFRASVPLLQLEAEKYSLQDKSVRAVPAGSDSPALSANSGSGAMPGTGYLIRPGYPGNPYGHYYDTYVPGIPRIPGVPGIPGIPHNPQDPRDRDPSQPPYYGPGYRGGYGYGRSGSPYYGSGYRGGYGYGRSGSPYYGSGYRGGNGYGR